MVTMGVLLDPGDAARTEDGGAAAAARDAIAWYRRAALQGAADVELTIGWALCVGFHDCLLFDWASGGLRSCALPELRVPFDFRYVGRGVKKDIPAAEEWVRKAAARGSSEAMFLLASIVMSDRGGSLGTSTDHGNQNETTEDEWIRHALAPHIITLAAEAHVSRALRKTAYLVVASHVPADCMDFPTTTTICSLTRAAAAKGHAVALFNLGIYQEIGRIPGQKTSKPLDRDAGNSDINAAIKTYVSNPPTSSFPPRPLPAFTYRPIKQPQPQLSIHSHLPLSHMF